MLHQILKRVAAHAALIATGLSLTAQLAHAVNVSPAVLYIDSRTREGTVTLHNGGRSPEEIDLGFQYGYQEVGRDGAVHLVLTAAPPAGAPSAVAWLRVFPRRLVLAPGETQVVRIIVRPPAGLPDGEYWARLVVSAVPQTPTIEERRGAATMQLKVGTRIVGGLHYRVGRTNTSLAVTRASATRSGGERVDLVLSLARGGNAAFIGRIRAKLLAADGAVIGEHTEPVTVFNGIDWRFTIPTKGAARVAAVEYTIDTRRDDLPAGTALPAPVVSGRVNISEGAADAARSQ